MLYKFYSIYDSKAEFYVSPITLPSRGAAVRHFTGMVNNTSHDFGKTPEDFTLFELGSYDELTGIIVPHDAPICVGNGLEFVNKS
jgi:hypothetical protein